MKILQEAVKTYQSSVQGKPSCFSDKEWKTWLMHEEIAHTEPRRFPCRDCTTEYQRRMVIEGKCLIPRISVKRVAR